MSVTYDYILTTDWGAPTLPISLTIDPYKEGFTMAAISVSHSDCIAQCRVCGQTKKQDEFYSKQLRKCGSVGECKDCTKRRVRSRSRSNSAVQAYDRLRARRPKVADRIRKNAADWNAKNPAAYKAHNAVSNAVRDGRMTKEPCLFCGEKKVHGHHRDYSKPLDVVWLCPKCHHRLHAVFPETSAHERNV